MAMTLHTGSFKNGGENFKAKLRHMLARSIPIAHCLGLGALFSLSACGSGIATNAKKLIGQPEQALIRSWGDPREITQNPSNGRRVLQYTRSVETIEQYELIPASPGTRLDKKTNERVPLTPAVYGSRRKSLSCLIRFIVDTNGAVADVTAEGPGC